MTGGGYRDKVGAPPSHPLGSTHLHRPQRPVGKEHPTSAVPHGHLAGLELEAGEALGQRRGVEDVADTRAAPAALQLWVTRRAQHHQPRPPAPRQPHQLTRHPLPGQTPPSLYHWGKPRSGGTGDAQDVLRPGARAPCGGTLGKGTGGETWRGSGRRYHTHPPKCSKCRQP